MTGELHGAARASWHGIDFVAGIDADYMRGKGILFAGNVDAENWSGLEVSMFAFNNEELIGAAVTALVSYADQLEGLLIGGMSYARRWIGLIAGVVAMGEEGKGVMIGGLVSCDELYGVQMGGLCSAGYGRYLQIGLITERVNDDGTRSMTPLIGFRWEKPVRKYAELTYLD
ncbi:hypothetical protein HYY74_01875 [Candidatus Woesearchaeota archaeon]|nr:hypothetical protein [Candidatus Woesearchaeota archaeon]